MTPLISVVIPTYSRRDLLFRCIDALLGQTVHDIEIIVVDNASPSNISDSVSHRYGPRVSTIRLAKNLFFCSSVNRGSLLASGRFLAVINDDCWVESQWAENALTTFAENHDIGAVASLVMKADGTQIIDSAGDHLDITGRATNILWGEPLSALSLEATPVFSAAGSCAIYRRDMFISAGRFDEDFIAYLDDIDLGFRMQLLGHPTMFNPGCRAYHVGGGTWKSRRYAAALLERNMLWNIVKNMPGDLVKRHFATMLAAHVVPAPLHDERLWRCWLEGKAGGVVGIRKMLHKRRLIQQHRRVSITFLESLLLSRSVSHCHL